MLIHIIHIFKSQTALLLPALYFKGVAGLVLAGIDEEKLPALCWEKSRGGELFPHLYGRLEPSHVARSWVLPLAQGRHEFPEGF